MKKHIPVWLILGVLLLSGGNLYAQGAGMGGCPWMGGGWKKSPRRAWKQPQPRINREQARVLLENRLGWLRDPDLRVGPLTETPGFFIAEITTKDGTLVRKLQIDRRTGWVQSVQ